MEIRLGVCTRHLREKGGVRELSCMRKEKKRREERNKVGASFFDEYPRGLAYREVRR